MDVGVGVDGGAHPAVRSINVRTRSAEVVNNLCIAEISFISIVGYV